VHVIAGASPDNTPAGYYWTFLFPEILFIVSALILWALFGRPHQRVPARRIVFGLSSRAPGAGPIANAATAAGSSAAPSGGAGVPGSVEVPASVEPEPAGDAVEADAGQPPADGAGDSE
jgi:hypothetical protein